MTEKSSISKSKGERRELEILEAAADMFFKKGFHATSLEDIANVVGIRKSSLYYYAKAKDELLFRICKQGMQSITEKLQDICRSEDTPTEKVRRAVENHFIALDTYFNIMGVMLREDRCIAPQYREDYIAMRDAYEKLFRGLIYEGISKGVFHPCDLENITRAILGMVSWLVVWYRSGGRLPAACISNQFVEFILKGLENRPL